MSDDARGDAREFAEIAHDMNTPLAILLANLEFLRELVARVGVDATVRIEREETRRWLLSQLDDAALCLHDVHEAAERIQRVVRRLGGARGATRDLAGTEDRAIKAQPGAAKGESRRPQVLVIDDEATMGRAIERVLRGCEVVIVGNPREALARVVAGERFDVILCDVMMPEMTGPSLYEQVAKAVPDQAERMIFITGGTTSSEAERLLAAAARPVLTKPFRSGELRAAVQGLCADRGRADVARGPGQARHGEPTRRAGSDDPNPR